MNNDFDPVEWGKVLEKLEAIEAKQDKLNNEVDTLKRAMHTGWGLIIGGVAVLGIFANELLAGFKRMIGIQ